MTGKSWAALIAAVVFSTQTAVAQETGSSPSSVDTVQSDDLPIGTPDSNGVGETYTAETHGDWEIRCIRVAEGQPEPCQLYQLLVDAGDSPVAEVNIFDVPDTDRVIAGATIVTPLDTLLSQQLRLQVDDGQVLRYPFTFCQTIGCFVRIGLTEENVDAFRQGGEAIVSIVPLQAPDQVADLAMSLTGFTAGYEALSVRAAAAQDALETLSQTE
ncbi:MAG: invasion associated locus B family protein [Pseudomonadota bacterium]